MSKYQGGAAAVFAKAYENFSKGLSDDEKTVFAGFADSTALITSIETLAKEHHIHKSCITACCEAVNTVGQRLMPYFKVVDIFVSSHPEYAALLWGAVRLMFVLGMNYVDFLEKFCKMLEDVTGYLPAYESLIDWMAWLEEERTRHRTVRELNPRLPDWLSLIYVDILQFCQEACSILSGKRGIRAKTKLVWNLSWRPFDVRFGQITERFKEHKKLINNEMKVTQIEITASHYIEFQKELLDAEKRRLEDEHRRKEKEQRALDKRIREIKLWIDAPDWEIPYEDICNRRCEGTGAWLFSEPAYQAWEEDLRTAWTTPTENEKKILFIQDTALSKLPRESYHRLGLQDSHNADDVGTFLREQFSMMDGLEDLIDLNDAVEKATIHANGMFRWARLLVEYLESDFLSDDDISAALANMVHLEGLDSLYAAIFSSLQTRRTGPARENSKRTFEWVTSSHRPLHIDELEVAISISGFKESIQNRTFEGDEE
ncbi:hypothetical protein SLS55_010426 [Diplodia seriata]|uniref:DUF7708 domain-containing protein n=1 Tax=Diplodia seriata TaxID=420778 RepID=A0ABR3BYQ9_9PEZI